MANPWFRMYSEFATDPKVQMMSELEQRRLLMIFCLRCNGHVTLQDEEVTFMLRISNDDWANTKKLFMSKGFINNDNEVMNWDKRQFVSDSSAERVARHRDKKRIDSNVTVTPPDTEQIQNRTDTESDTERPKTPLATLMAMGVSKKPAQDWLRIRKDKKLTFTDDAMELFLSEIEKANLTIVEAIKFCNGKSWGSFKASWYAKEIAIVQNGGNGFKTKFQHVKENNDKAFDEFLGITEKPIDGEVVYD
jgi:hypothetical protein